MRYQDVELIQPLFCLFYSYASEYRDFYYSITIYNMVLPDCVTKLCLSVF
jgi:hypothetical protein